MLAGNFSKDLASFSKIRFPFPKIPVLLPKGFSYLDITRVFNNLFLMFPRCHFQTILQTSSKWLFDIKICSRVSCRLPLGIALSTYYKLHTRKERAYRKAVTLGGFAPFLGNFSDLMKLHELQMNNFHSTEYLDVSNTMPGDMTNATKMRRTSAEKELENGKSNVLGCL